MHTYKAVQQGAGGEYVLVKDGQVALCPKVASVVPQAGTGLNAGRVAMIPQKPPCGTNCPFATITEEDQFEENQEGGGNTNIGKKPVYNIRCEGGHLKILLDEVRPFPKKEE